MFKNKTFLGIIPARGGSKRLPRKNILDLQGKPLIAWTIDSGLKSKYIDEVMVTTDDIEIMEISKTYGAMVPFQRPKNLSNDTATRSDVIKHTIEFYVNHLQKKFDYIVYLQPTSPLRNAHEIDKAIEYMFDKQSDAVVSVCELEHPMPWVGTLPRDLEMSKFLNEAVIKSRSQDFETYYRLNGAIYICNTMKFIEEGCIFLSKNIYAYLMPVNMSVDIDTLEDFEYARFILSFKN